VHFLYVVPSEIRLNAFDVRDIANRAAAKDLLTVNSSGHTWVFVRIQGALIYTKFLSHFIPTSGTGGNTSSLLASQPASARQ
jgi:hypothetical protein